MSDTPQEAEREDELDAPDADGDDAALHADAVDASENTTTRNNQDLEPSTVDQTSTIESEDAADEPSPEDSEPVDEDASSLEEGAGLEDDPEPGGEAPAGEHETLLSRLIALPRKAAFFWSAFAVIVASQTFICFLGLGDLWARGHNGWNGSAYHLSARNSLRWDILFPVQYYTGRFPPAPESVYTHHPLAMHLHNTGSLWLFGDSEAAVRAVPALHGVLALIAIILVVRRFWGPGTALLAGAVYTILPVNAIYANMMNHSNGFIFYAFIFFYCYLRFHEARKAAHEHPGVDPPPWKRWYLGTFLAFFMASAWDWPAYYLALACAFHWFITALAWRVRSRRPLWKLGVNVALLIPWCVWVLACFAGHFLLTHLMVGSLEELTGTASARQDVDAERFAHHLDVVPELMFTWPVLALCLTWLVITTARLIMGRMPARDIIGLAFGVGGAFHYVVFKWSAIVHSYWAWTMLPFVAIATASTLVELRPLLERAARAALERSPLPEARAHAISRGVSLAIFALLIPLALRSADLVPRGRAVAGSLWFIEEVRPSGIEAYRSGRPELRFAEQVRGWTTRDTGVLIHRSFNRLVPEPRFDITLDREIQYVDHARPDRLDVPPLDPRPGVKGWVFIGLTSALPARSRAVFASRHPYWEFGQFFMVDLRSHQPDVRIWTLEEREPHSFFEWYWSSPFEKPVEATRDAAAEAQLMKRVRALPRI